MLWPRRAPQPSRSGLVTIPWLNGGNPTRVPELTLGELLDANARDLARLREAGLADGTADWERERILDICDLALTADVAYLRLSKADSTLTRERFELEVNTRPKVLAVATMLADADEAVYPRTLPASPARGADTKGPAAAPGSSTSTSWRSRAATWLRTRSRWGSTS